MDQKFERERGADRTAWFWCAAWNQNNLNDFHLAKNRHKTTKTQNPNGKLGQSHTKIMKRKTWWWPKKKIEWCGFVSSSSLNQCHFWSKSDHHHSIYHLISNVYTHDPMDVNLEKGILDFVFDEFALLLLSFIWMISCTVYICVFVDRRIVAFDNEQRLTAVPVSSDIPYNTQIILCIYNNILEYILLLLIIMIWYFRLVYDFVCVHDAFSIFDVMVFHGYRELHICYTQVYRIGIYSQVRGKTWIACGQRRHLLILESWFSKEICSKWMMLARVYCLHTHETHIYISSIMIICNEYIAMIHHNFDSKTNKKQKCLLVSVFTNVECHLVNGIRLFSLSLAWKFIIIDVVLCVNELIQKLYIYHCAKDSVDSWSIFLFRISI